MRLVSGFVALGVTIGGLAVESAPAAMGAAKASPFLCRLPVARAVVVAGPGARARASAAKPAPAAVIRVDQIGYPAAGTKLAEILTASRRAGTRWELIRRGSRGSCQVVAAGRARTDLGPWNRGYPAVWAVTFSGVHRAGSYRLVLTGHPGAASPWFRIGSPSGLYRGPLRNALSFFQNERDGPGLIRSALRTAPGHLNDAHAMTFRAPPVDQNGNFKGSLARFATGLRINATGGWFDAGDYLHFTATTSYTVAMMLTAMAAFPAQVGRRGQVSFAAEAKFGLDFLRRMWNERSRTLYMQVGTGEANSDFVADHDIWRLPQADDHYQGTNPHYQYIRHPPVFLAGRPGSVISPNLAGRLAADFALCYRVFQATRPGYANGCLRSALTIYSMAATRYWKGNLVTALPWDFYPEVSWRDDMMLGATELALALHAAHRPGPAATYLRDAAHWARAWFGGTADGQDTLNLYDVSALADYEMYRAIGVIGVHRLAVGRRGLLADLRGQIRHAAKIGAREPFGFGFAWAQWDTTTHGLGLSIMANEYDALAGRPVYAAWGQRQLDNVLGANPWGVSLIVGDGTVFPECMQHQVANLAGSRDGAAPILTGAVVEGPNSFAATGWVTSMRSCRVNGPGNVPYGDFNGRGAVFADNVQSFSTVEPAIDLTSLSPLAFAWQEAGSRAGY